MNDFLVVMMVEDNETNNRTLVATKIKAKDRADAFVVGGDKIESQYPVGSVLLTSYAYISEEDVEIDII